MHAYFETDFTGHNQVNIKIDSKIVIVRVKRPTQKP